MITLQWRTAIALSLIIHLAFFGLIVFVAGKTSRSTDYISVELIQPSGGLTQAMMPASRPRNVLPREEQKPLPEAKQEPPADNAMGMKEKVMEAPQAPPEQAQSGPATGAGQGPYQPFHTLSRIPFFKVQMKPEYPSSERAAGREARVVVEVYINERGGVDDVKLVKSGGTLFDQAVIKAVKASSFAPGYLSGRPVPVRVQIPYAFKLR